MKKTKAQKFIELFHYWCGRLKIHNSVNIIKDNRIDCASEVKDWDNNKIALRYHSRKLGQLYYFSLICCVFHEMAHIINNLPYDTEKEQIYSEYKAEKFALKMMKKYYFTEYKQLIKYFKDKQIMKKLEKIAPLYYKTFLKIKEYRDTIREK